MKIIDRTEIAKLIKDDSTVLFNGFGMAGFAEESAISIRDHFDKTGKPENLTIINAGAGGNNLGDGVGHFAAEKLLKKVVTGHVGGAGKALQNLIADNKVEGYNLPQGVIVQLIRRSASKQPGMITKVGLNTFIDPRIEGGKLNEISTDDLVELFNYEDEEYLLYKTPKVDVAILRATYADEKGNISMAHESTLQESIEAATAARANGGIVIVEVKQIVTAGSLHAKTVKIPFTLVDYVVLSRPENHFQTNSSLDNPAFYGEIKVPLESIKPMDLTMRKVIARRAAMELKPNAIVNVGIGVPDGVPNVAAEEGVGDELIVSTEGGAIGGIPAQGDDFGHAYNPEAIIEQAEQFDIYDSGNIDVAFLGLGEVDKHGDINVSKLGGLPVGVGGFVNISQSAKKVVFCGAFTAGGLKTDIKDGKISIVNEGKHVKFKENVAQISFASKFSEKNNQEVVYVTERAVFKLIDGEIVLTEIAPGIDLERDVVANMEFQPKVSENVKEMDSGIFQETWGKLEEIINAMK